VEITLPFAGRAIRGTVDHVGTEVSEITQSVKIRIVAPNLDDELKPDMLVRVTIDPAS
jgi:multidrug efflux pump subunit AcrA (membrane-fusion protein)